jgi:hypothetical protein
VLTKSFMLSVVAWVVFAGVLRVTTVPPESCGKTDMASLEAAARAASQWIIRNQQRDGSFTYRYLIDTDTIPNEYNMVRHAGLTMTLYQASGHYQDPELLAAADAGLGWMVQRLVQRHGWSVPVLANDDAILGSAALMTVGLAERRLVTGDDEYDALMREVGRFILALQRADGGFDVAWDLNADAPVTGQTSKYYPGESLWALALLAEAFPGEGWDVAARHALDYLVTQRDELEHTSYPPLADQWLAYGLAEMSDWGLTDDQLAFARRLAGRFGLYVRSESEREGGAIGRLMRGRESRAAGLGTWVEGLSSMWRLSATNDGFSDLEPKLKERLVCAAGILAARQANEATANESAAPDIVLGAWFARGETRMDDQQHALSGLLYTIDALEGSAQRAPATPVLVSP